MKQESSTTIRWTESIRDVLDQATHGYLALNSESGWPVVRPVNFVRLDGRIYFHGSAKGGKMGHIERDPRSTFVVVLDFALIPSYFIHPRNACPATQYYKSVLIQGTTRIVTDLHEKARALQALMEKLQPEGGHEPITAESSTYRKAVETTAVLAIEIDRMSGKFGLGQAASDRKRRGIESGLAGRGCPVDHSTLEAMEEFRDRPRIVHAHERKAQ